MATQFRQIGGQLGEHFGVEGHPTGIYFTANPVGCIGTIKALLGLRVKRFGRVLVPFATGYAALGAPFLGRGQPVDDVVLLRAFELGQPQIGLLPVEAVGRRGVTPGLAAIGEGGWPVSHLEDVVGDAAGLVDELVVEEVLLAVADIDEAGRRGGSGLENGSGFQQLGSFVAPNRVIRTLSAYPDDISRTIPAIVHPTR